MRRTWTLVEALVVLAVVLVATCLLLPPIRAAQDQARAIQCVTNLKQIGLALHNYHSANSSFPMSSLTQGGLGHGHSGFTALLPYLELSRVYNGYNFWLANWHLTNSTAVRTQIGTYVCPDNPAIEPTLASAIRTIDGQPYGGKSVFAASHYGMNWGGGRAGWGTDFERQYGGGGQGVLLSLPSLGPNGKPNRTIRLADVLDGTSFTLAIVEKRAGRGWAVGGWAGSEFDAHSSPSYDGDDPLSRRVYPGSEHPEGVSALFCDGSVRRLKPTIDRAVWFALLTRASGEVIDPKQLD